MEEQPMTNTRNIAECAYCRQPIWWVVDGYTDGWLALDPDPVAVGDTFILGPKAGRSEGKAARVPADKMFGDGWPPGRARYRRHAMTCMVPGVATVKAALAGRGGSRKRRRW